jgi:hypothetical protein
VLILVLWLGISLFLFYSFREQYRLETEVNAEISKVTFLKLPSSATKVSYWRDGISYLAEFQVPEAEFRQLFKSFDLQEIETPIEVFRSKFGNPKLSPFQSRFDSPPVRIADGFKFEVIWSNGGGYNIVYDRKRSQAYYEFRRR